MNPLQLLTMAMLLAAPGSNQLDIHEQRKRLQDKSAFGVSGHDLLDKASGLHRMWAQTIKGKVLPVRLDIEPGDDASATWLYAPTEEGSEPALDAMMVSVMVTLTGHEDRFQLSAQGTVEKNADQAETTTELSAQVLTGELSPDGVVMQLLPDDARDVFLTLQATLEQDEVRNGRLDVAYTRVVDGEEEQFHETLLTLNAFSVA